MSSACTMFWKFILVHLKPFWFIQVPDYSNENFCVGKIKLHIMHIQVFRDKTCLICIFHQWSNGYNVGDKHQQACHHSMQVVLLSSTQRSICKRSVLKAQLYCNKFPYILQSWLLPRGETATGTTWRYTGRITWYGHF